MDSDRLQMLRAPFLPNQISKLPKPKSKDAPKGHCDVCGGWHGLPAVHLDYVGHAALTDRLLDVDPGWTWEPLSIDATGLPVLDGYGGMWIRLTICGVTRLGYGDAGDKTGGNAIKEVIGDALRNAAMRFGAALDLWHKGDLHGDDPAPPSKPAQVGQVGAITGVKAAVIHASGGVEGLGDMAGIDALAINLSTNFAKIGPARTALFLDQEDLNSDQLLYLSTKLPSAMNNAIKKAQTQQREATKENA